MALGIAVCLGVMTLTFLEINYAIHIKKVTLIMLTDIYSIIFPIDEIITKRKFLIIWTYSY